MFIVVVGARERKSVDDEKAVVATLEELRNQYGSSMVVISAACDAGIGTFVKQRCLVNKKDFRFIEIALRIYADLPRSRMMQAFKARNAFLADLGDEFYIFTDPDHPVTTDDLIARIKKVEADTGSARPTHIYPKVNV